MRAPRLMAGQAQGQFDVAPARGAGDCPIHAAPCDTHSSGQPFAANQDNIMNADHPLIKNLEDATRENDALREVLRLMGFDAQKVIDAVRSPVNNFWYRATLCSVTSSINTEDPRIAHFNDKAVASMQAVFSSLRIQPQSASASARLAADLAV